MAGFTTMPPPGFRYDPETGDLIKPKTPSQSQPDDLKSLGSGGSDFDKIEKAADASLLERFPSPMRADSMITLGGHDDPKEFTSLCPKTGQPDFARVVVEYAPGEWCVESKSWKLYLGSYRTAREFHEACIQRICDDLVDLLNPNWIRVKGEFTPRGGISINPVATYHRNPNSVAQRA